MILLSWQIRLFYFLTNLCAVALSKPLFSSFDCAYIALCLCSVLPDFPLGKPFTTLQYRQKTYGGARVFSQGSGRGETAAPKWAVMEDINRHYCLAIDICHSGNVSDRVDMEEEEKVRTFHSPQDEPQLCCSNEMLEKYQRNQTQEKRERPGD